MPSFKARVENFWQWFAGNEAALAACLDAAPPADPAPARELLADAVNRVIEDMPFEFGSGLEINLSANGRHELAFLTGYLAKNLPEPLAGRWTVNPLTPAAGADFRIGIAGQSAGPGDVRVSVTPVGNGRFFLRYGNDVLDGMEETAANYFFFLLLDAALGEAVSISHIDGVARADAPESGMIPLSKLRDTLAGELAKEGRALDANPCESYLSYSGRPGDTRNPSELPLRHDILAGFTGQQRLMDEYYSENHSVADLYDEAGAKACFIWYFHGHGDLRAALEERNEISERLIAEVLGEPDTGKELGRNIGLAIAPTRCYLDFLLYDEAAFLDKAVRVLKDYSHAFHITAYRPGAESIVLSPAHAR